MVATSMFLLVDAVNIINDGSGSSRLRPIPRVAARVSGAVCEFPKRSAFAILTGPSDSFLICAHTPAAGLNGHFPLFSRQYVIRSSSIGTADRGSRVKTK